MAGVLTCKIFRHEGWGLLKITIASKDENISKREREENSCFQRVKRMLVIFLLRRMSKARLSFSLTDNSEIISRNGMECQESALRITKHCYCTYYPVSSSIELPQTAC